MRSERQQRGARDDSHVHPEVHAHAPAMTLVTDELNNRPQGERMNDNRNYGRRCANNGGQKYVYAVLRSSHLTIVWRSIRSLGRVDSFFEIPDHFQSGKFYG